VDAQSRGGSHGALPRCPGPFDCPKGGVTQWADAMPLGSKVVSAKPRIMFTAVGDANPSLFRYWVLKDSAELDVTEAGVSDQEQYYLDRIPRNDFVVASDIGSAFIASFMPSYKIQDRLLADLRSRPDLREVGAFTSR